MMRIDVLHCFSNAQWMSQMNNPPPDLDAWLKVMEPGSDPISRSSEMITGQLEEAMGQLSNCNVQ